MSKSVCKTCVCKLDEFHRFREACVQAEIALESNLKDQQSSAFPLEPEVIRFLCFIDYICQNQRFQFAIVSDLECSSSSHLLEEPGLMKYCYKNSPYF